MVDLYVALIIADRRTFSQVPVRFQEAVRADLLAIGLDENGVFYHNGNEIERQLTLEEKTNLHDQQVTELQGQNAQMLFSLVNGGLL